MCLATVFLQDGEEAKPVLKNITKAVLENDSWVFTDVIGKKKRLDGDIREIDLTDNYIILSTPQP